MALYFEDYKLLKRLADYTVDEVKLDNQFVMRNFSFASKHSYLLPGGSENSDNFECIANSKKYYEPDIIQEMLNKQDAEISENLNFRYHIIMPATTAKSDKIIIMFHGFNEKYWDKYLPWAKYLAENTGKAVVMFPIAFHMNRAPLIWSDTHGMYKISQQRKEWHPEVINSSLSNVAISTRLHTKPQRFIWSGLQTYYDVIDLVENIRSGKHTAIEKDATIDFFSYSIGTFLGEILMMTNGNDYFSGSKYASFCGGAVFNRLSPVSKFILDSEANVNLYSFLVEHLESHMKRDEVLRHYLNDYEVGINFKCMLNYKTLTKYREDKFRSLADRFYTISLANDEVVPPYEIINTLQGIARNIPMKVDVLDFPYPYTHENPFPTLEKIRDQVNEQFNLVFNKFCEFLR